jgi:hypothetical protein
LRKLGQFILTALKLAQHAVDQPFQLRTLNDNRAFDCLSQRGVLEYEYAEVGRSPP